MVQRICSEERKSVQGAAGRIPLVSTFRGCAADVQMDGSNIASGNF